MRHDLHEVDEMNSAAVTPWRDTLHRIFSSDSKVSNSEKAQVLGVPERRQFLRVGGATVLGAAVLAACGGDDGDTASTSATTAGGASSTTEGNGGGGVDDLTLAKTAASLEALAVVAYQTAADSGIVTNKDVGAAAMLFMQHHTEHQAALNKVITDAGGDKITEPNSAVNTAIVEPAVKEATDLAEKGDAEGAQTRIIQLAYDLETAAAQTYVFAAGVLSTPELRSTIMTIGGVESRHATILGNVLEFAPDKLYPTAFYKSDNPLPEDAIIS